MKIITKMWIITLTKGGGGQTLSKFLYTKQGSLFYSNMESASYSRRLDIP
ncbi:hypothetical protein [Helicobacter bilis]|nr:hypothetical protein [Helicobacter bilis]